jgi:hypothetical protein
MELLVYAGNIMSFDGLVKAEFLRVIFQQAVKLMTLI